MRFHNVATIGMAIGLGLAAAACTPTSAQDNTARDESGAIVEEGEVGAFSIQLGDCLTGVEEGLIESAQGVSCDRSHQYEVYYIYRFPEGDYPGDTVVETTADAECLAAFDSFVGLNYAESVYGFFALQPVQQSWEIVDDREVLCLIGMYDGTDKTGTARGTSI